MEKKQIIFKRTHSNSYLIDIKIYFNDSDERKYTLELFSYIQNGFGVWSFPRNELFILKLISKNLPVNFNDLSVSSNDRATLTLIINNYFELAKANGHIVEKVNFENFDEITKSIISQIIYQQ